MFRGAVGITPGGHAGDRGQNSRNQGRKSSHILFIRFCVTTLYQLHVIAACRARCQLLRPVNASIDTGPGPAAAR